MDEKKYTLDDIETLRSKPGVGYEEAAFAATDVDLDGARRIEDGIKGQGPVDVGVVDDEGFVVFWEHG